MNRMQWQGLALATAVTLSQPATADGGQREMTLDEVLAHAEEHAPLLSVARQRARRRVVLSVQSHARARRWPAHWRRRQR